LKILVMIELFDKFKNMKNDGQSFRYV